ncbi:hypothetical protein GGR52DRAFT_568466 [Hypoxylon sp. FL1284]|nr:hypothetical protein GGR52DRAFT_568466 [Hypoxylon sp. FL1284]
MEEQPNPTITDVKSSETALGLVKTLYDLPAKCPSIFLDVGRFKDGKIVFLNVFIPSQNTIYRVWIDGPYKANLSTKNAAGMSLDTILQSEPIPKVVFDVRGISKALFNHHEASLDGTWDLQLMELASRDPEQSKKYVVGFTKCV